MELLSKIADDTSRSYLERDLARILQISSELLIEGDVESSVQVLKRHIDELMEIKLVGSRITTNFRHQLKSKL